MPCICLLVITEAVCRIFNTQPGSIIISLNRTAIQDTVEPSELPSIDQAYSILELKRFRIFGVHYKTFHCINPTPI